MEIRVINAAQVRHLLPMAGCIDAMEEALKALARGEAENPLRSMVWLPDKRGLLVSMPSVMGEAMGIKVISVMPENHGTAYDSHMGAVLLFETKHGQPLALIDASEITAIRTAAVSGVATRLLAREDASDLAILGTGVQADSHLEAMLAVRKVRQVRVWSRSAVHRETFAARAAERYRVTVTPVVSAQEAVQHADIICTTTSSNEPVLYGEWLSAGAHLNVVGASVPTAREVDSDAMRKASLFVDRRESTLNEAGDFLIPKREGLIGDDHIRAELGDILLGNHAGRTAPEEITLFKSLGLAVEDLASAQYIYQQALEQGIGTAVDFGATRTI
ncbi:MAG: ornithine cyclodeaminase [Anaerolineaceae bacterium]|nr:ornithine cyclodeaminase [Anaerolineaceae bacterium]